MRQQNDRNRRRREIRMTSFARNGESTTPTHLKLLLQNKLEASDRTLERPVMTGYIVAFTMVSLKGVELYSKSRFISQKTVCSFSCNLSTIER